MNNRLALRWGLVAVVVVGLAIDAYVHFDLASQYAMIPADISQGALFRIEGASAIIAAIAVIGYLRWYTAAFAAAVTGGGAFLVLLYRYVDVGAFGPFADMYEPVWYTEKTLSFWAEVIAFVAALGLLAITLHARRRTPQPA